MLSLVCELQSKNQRKTDPIFNLFARVCGTNRSILACPPCVTLKWEIED